MEQGIRDQPASGLGPLPRGFVMGGLFAVCAVAVWVIVLVLASALDNLWWLLDLVFPGLMIAILAVGYLLGLAAAIHRPTRRASDSACSLV